MSISFKPATIILAINFLFLICLSACKDESTAPRSNLEQYEAALNKWNTSKISNYSYTLGLNCFCPKRWPYSVQVKSNLIVQVTDASGVVYTDGSTAVDKQGFKTIDDIFRFIKTSLDRDPAEVKIRYNAQYGYPESVWFDYDRGVADEEMGYEITDLKTRL